MKMALLATVFAALWAGVSADAQTVDQRLKAVEKKTDFYKVARLTRKKTWTHLRSSARAEDFEATTFWEIPTGQTDPLLTNVWVRIQANYRHPSGGNFISANVGLVGVPGGSGTAPSVVRPICTQTYRWQGLSGEVDNTFVCHGVINAQNGEVLRIGIQTSAAGTATIDGLTITAHLVNEVLTEPSP